MPTVLKQKPEYKLKVECDDEPINPRKEYDNFAHMACWHRNYNLGDEHDFDEPSELLKQMIRDTLSADEVIDYVKKSKLDDVRMIYNRSEREWELQDEYNGKWFTEYTFSPNELKNSDEAKDCVLEVLSINSLKELAERKNIMLPLYLYDHSGITMSCSHTYPYNDRWDSGQVGWIYASHNEIEKEYGTLSADTIENAENLMIGEVETYDSYLRGECYGFTLEKNGEEIDSCWGFLGDLREVREDMKSYVSDEQKHLFDNIDYCCMEYAENEEYEDEDEYDM